MRVHQHRIYRTTLACERRSAPLPETAPGRHQVLEPERGGDAVYDDLRRRDRTSDDAAEQVAGDEGDEQDPARNLHTSSVGSSRRNPVIGR